MSEINNIDEYIKQYPQEQQERMILIRNTILEVEPTLQEKMSWGMPTFWLQKNIIHFAMHKSHIGIYPGPDAIVHFNEQLKGYKCSKGAIRLPNDKPVPTSLIKQILKYNLEN